MGLWFAQQVVKNGDCPILDGENPQAFVTRQIMKAWLAYGDCQLADHGMYHCNVLMRQEHLNQCWKLNKQWWVPNYRAAIAFKLDPQPDLPGWLTQQNSKLLSAIVHELKHRPAAPTLSLAGLYRTMRSCPVRTWLRTIPGQHPRDRLRRSLAGLLTGNDRSARYLLGGSHNLTSIWNNFG